MNKQHISFAGFAAFTVLSALSGCELKSEMYDAINPTIYPQSERDARDLVTAAAYLPFRNDEYDGIFNVATGVSLTADMTSDYGFCSWDDGGTWTHLNFAAYTPADNRNATKGWDGFLNSISKMTLNIDRISNLNINPDVKQQLIAELQCARGFMAFLIYDLFGPLIIADLNTLKDPLTERILPRLSDEDTRAFIVDNLTQAADVLPHSYKRGDANYGRFTKGLCHMILLKFYMQTHQFELAIQHGQELTKPDYGYALVTEKGSAPSAYANIFTEANEQNAETIWSAICKEGNLVHLWYPHVLPNNYGGFSGGWGGFKMTWDFFHTFELGDDRRETILYEYTDFTTGELLNEDNKGTSGNSFDQGVFPVKYAIEPNVGDHCQTDWIVYRYADALTLLAEALTRHTNTVSPEAIDLLNQVRTRASLPPYTSTDFTSTADFLDKLLLERAHELYFEGSRRQDLIRDGSYIDRLNAKCRAFGKPELVSSKHLLFPLKESVINEGKGLVLQNPGY
ncbi:MAG: RagB/SusD family nutrient uptake outer membrane protein [Tannerellaceae bacterium]|jgi:hypothetical protein|nr:RagB/SusD family nutrient uptake outer membrane protein [Tannerellaceae bacterium]